ncbi:MAG: extracellular solute-binding protein [Deltaproteobacteria bacterium]|nr:extracellular solute-binding protein [Deltaproteobacteria bacterium]
MKPLWILCAALLLLSRSVVLCSAQEPRPAKSGEEQKVILYSVMTAPDMQRIIERFRKKYPSLDVESYRSSGERLIQRIVTEIRAGRYLADVYIISGLQMWLLKEEGHLLPYLSPQREGVGKSFKDEAGYWTGFFYNLEVIGYNTKLAAPYELPKRWEDLLDQRWKGRMALESEDIPWFTSVLQIMGEDQGKQFARRLAKQQLQIRTGHTLISQLLAAGEVALAPTVRVNAAESLKRKGASLDWTVIEPLAPNPPISVAMAKSGPHPNSARLFIDFILSREGQTIVREVNRNPTRLDVEQPVPRASKVKLFEMNWERVTKNYSRYVREFNEIFGQAH